MVVVLGYTKIAALVIFICMLLMVSCGPPPTVPECRDNGFCSAEEKKIGNCADCLIDERQDEIKEELENAGEEDTPKEDLGDSSQDCDKAKTYAVGTSWDYHQIVNPQDHSEQFTIFFQKVEKNSAVLIINDEIFNVIPSEDAANKWDLRRAGIAATLIGVNIKSYSDGPHVLEVEILFRCKEEGSCPEQNTCGGNCCQVDEYCSETTICAPKCSDTDGGLDIYTKGSVETTASSNALSDTCAPVGHTVVEAYCNVGTMSTKRLTCPESHTCREGACVSGEKTECGTRSLDDLFSDEQVQAFESEDEITQAIQNHIDVNDLKWVIDRIDFETDPYGVLKVSFAFCKWDFP